MVLSGEAIIPEYIPRALMQIRRDCVSRVMIPAPNGLLLGYRARGEATLFLFSAPRSRGVYATMQMSAPCALPFVP